MKLLAKSDIHQKRAAEQKQTIDEGKKLASTIDRLREVAAQEDASLDKFRSETLARIHEETTEAATKRDALLGEVRELEAAKREALQPLTEEQKKLDDTKTELEQKRAEIATQSLTLEDRERSISGKEQEVVSTLLRVRTKEEAVTKKLADIINKEEKTTFLNLEVTRLKEEAESIRTKLSTELVHREQVCENTEKSLS